MRIRKRTPARAASPPPPPPPKELPREEEDDDEPEEKRVILVAGAGGREDGRVPVSATHIKNSAATDGLPKPEPLDAADRCSRNDGKRWRCKNAAVPGFPFCDRHVAWSVRQRQPRANKRQMKKNDGGGVFEPVPVGEEEADDKGMDDDGSAAGAPRLVRHEDDGFYYYGGFQPGGRKRARAGGMNQQP